MPDTPETDDSSFTESADMIVEPDPDDPADLTGQAAQDTVEHQDDEVDQIAAAADPTGLGHGPSDGDPDQR